MIFQWKDIVTELTVKAVRKDYSFLMQIILQDIIFDWEELEEWFSCLCWENGLFCNYCDCENCYTCERFHFNKDWFNEVGYSVARDWPFQPAEWQIHEKYFLMDKFNFDVKIEKTVKLQYLIKKYDFLEE